MIPRLLPLLSLVVAIPALAAHDDNPPWSKPEQAHARAAMTGKPTLYFVSTDLTPGGGSLQPALDRIFGARTIRALWEEFLWVKVADQKTMEFVKANSVNEVIICDPDQRELFRGVVKGAPDALKGMEDALKKYASRPIPYKTYDPALLKEAAAAGRPLIVVFADGSKDCQVLLSSLEDRMVAQLTPKCDFVRFAFKKESEDVKHWNILSAPTLLVLDGGREEGPKAALERTTGKKTPPEIKNLLLRAIRALEKKDPGDR